MNEHQGKTMMQLRSIPALLIIAVTAPLSADVVPDRPTTGFDSSAWPEQIPVAGGTEQAGLARIEVEPRIYRLSGKDFSTLRLIRSQDGAQFEQPWVLRKIPAPERTVPQPFRQEMESFTETADGAIEIVVSLTPAPSGPLRLHIDTPLRDFEKGISVAIPAAEGAWRELVGDGLLFDHSRFLDFRRTSLDLPGSGAGRIRIRIADASDEQRSRLREITRTVGDSSGVVISESARIESRDFRIDGLRLTSLRKEPAPARKETASHPLTILKSEGLEGGVTAVEFDGGNLPIERLLLTSEDRNFRRAVSLQIPGPERDWRTLHRAHLHRYEVGDFRDESLGFELTETRSDRYRLLIENGSNPAVGITSVSAAGPRHEIFFLADPGVGLSFLVGAESADRPTFDAAAIHAALSKKVPARTLTLGDAVPNPGFVKSTGPKPPGFLESKSALWLAIAAAVAVLIRVLYGSLRKVEEETVG